MLLSFTIIQINKYTFEAVKNVRILFIFILIQLLLNLFLKYANIFRLKGLLETLLCNLGIVIKGNNWAEKMAQG